MPSFCKNINSNNNKTTIRRAVAVPNQTTKSLLTCCANCSRFVPESLVAETAELLGVPCR